MFFISDAYAGAEAVAQSSFGSIVMLLSIPLVFYFLIWRPQSKKSKDHRELISSIKSGDEVVLSGGILGKIVKIDENHILLNIAKDVNIKIQKNAISNVFPKGTIDKL